MDLLKKIQDDAFNNTHVDYMVPREIEGWMCQSFLDNFIMSLHHIPKKELIVIEVGSWKGLSANMMAKLCKDASRIVKIICVDTWLGSVEHQDTMVRNNGYPTIYDDFLKNTKHTKNNDVIYPFPIASTEGAHYLHKHGVQADIIYIDAGHEYESVAIDVKLYWNILAPGGVMIFDDYTWDGVKRAVDEFCEMNNLHKIVNNEQVVLLK
jgi:SAM-dependent methyltransferase